MSTLLLILVIWFLASIVVGFAMARFIEAGKRQDDFSRWLANPKGEQ
jgi:hypothetical protein